MPNKESQLVPGRKASLPTIYVDTPSFLGCQVVDSKAIEKRFDVIFSGIPWEGTITLTLFQDVSWHLVPSGMPQPVMGLFAGI